MSDQTQQNSEPSEHTDGDPADSGSSGLAAIAALTAERDDAIDNYRRAIADYQNYHRRSIENEREARRQGVTEVLQSIIPVLDHFDLALSHRSDNPATLQVIDGVKVIRDELLKVLGRHGIGIIRPAAGDELDPQRHQVIMQQAAEGVQPGLISLTLQVGYVLEQRVIRPAKVAVAPGAAD